HSPVGRRRLAVRQVREDILDMDHRDHLIERFTVNRQARVSVLAEGVDHLLPRSRCLDGDNLASRDGDVVGVMLAEVEQVAEHGQFDRRQVAVLRRLAVSSLLVFVLGNGFFDLRAQRSLAGFVEEFAYCGPQTAFTVRVSVAGVAVSGIFGHRPSSSPLVRDPYGASRSPYGSAIPNKASAFISDASIASASSSDIS